MKASLLHQRGRGTPQFLTVCSEHAKAREVELLSWQCAVERLLWSNPFCMTSGIYIINLGVVLGLPTGCLTDQNGF